MDKKYISVVSGAAMLALTGSASAGPMSVASPQTVTPPSQIEPVYYRYYRHRHYRHYGWHRGWHYGWYRHRYYRRYYGYYNPGAAVAGAAVGLATLPFAAATGWPYYYGYPYYGYRYYW